MATTASPTWSADESPNASGCNSLELTSTWITARSVVASEPTSFASAVVPSANVSLIDVAFSTTWWFVTMSPLESITKPVPCAERAGAAASRGRGRHRDLDDAARRPAVDVVDGGRGGRRIRGVGRGRRRDRAVDDCGTAGGLVDDGGGDGRAQHGRDRDAGEWAQQLHGGSLRVDHATDRARTPWAGTATRLGVPCEVPTGFTGNP